MSGPEREHAEALLADVLVGERRLDDPEVQAALAQFPDLGDGLDSLRGLDQRLASAGREALTERAGSAASPPGPSTAELAALVRRQLAPRPGRGPWLLAAALVLGALLLTLRLAWREAAPGPQLLGPLQPGQLEAVVVDGEVEFGWNLALPAGADYVLRVHVGVAGAQPILVQNTGRRPSWRMKLSELEALANGATWPLIWEVRALGVGGIDGSGLGPARVPR